MRGLQTSCPFSVVGPHPDLDLVLVVGSTSATCQRRWPDILSPHFSLPYQRHPAFILLYSLGYLFNTTYNKNIHFYTRLTRVTPSPNSLPEILKLKSPPLLISALLVDSTRLFVSNPSQRWQKLSNVNVVRKKKTNRPVLDRYPRKHVPQRERVQVVDLLHLHNPVPGPAEVTQDLGEVEPELKVKVLVRVMELGVCFDFDCHTFGPFSLV